MMTLMLIEGKEDSTIGNFEQAMKEASRAGALFDRERRKLAGDAATMLMGLQDKMGYDNENGSHATNSSDDDISR